MEGMNKRMQDIIMDISKRLFISKRKKSLPKVNINYSYNNDEADKVQNINAIITFGAISINKDHNWENSTKDEIIKGYGSISIDITTENVKTAESNDVYNVYDMQRSVVLSAAFDVGDSATTTFRIDNIHTVDDLFKNMYDMIDRYVETKNIFLSYGYIKIN